MTMKQLVTVDLGELTTRNLRCISDGEDLGQWWPKHPDEKENEMNQFVNAIQNQEARTVNGMKARETTANKNVDLFFKIGASRGKDILPGFTAAYVENPEYALRIAQWARDVRGGAGERKLYRDILKTLSTDQAKQLIDKTPELGRWDDLLVDFDSTEARDYAYDKIKTALDEGNGLCAKWMPRKGELAAKLRNHFGWTPKYYRKRLVELTSVVETQMCANEWEAIDYNKIPSVASARYKKAFNRHTPDKFKTYVEKLVRGDKDVKVNAGAVYPYDVLKGLVNYYGRTNYTATEKNHILSQWNALPNYVGDAKILPLVDVSGSMTCQAGGIRSKSTLTCLDVAVSLGLYLADKNTGVFKDSWLTFSTLPKLSTLRGDILQKVVQMATDRNWAGSTDLHAAFNTILNTAVDNNVPQEDMPDTLLILSDMQFNYCTRYDDSAMQMIRRKYSEAGYTAPGIVFWNLNAYDNVPVKFDERGVALVSGFSPTIVKSVLSSNMEDMTPEAIMLKTILDDRYAVSV